MKCLFALICVLLIAFDVGLRWSQPDLAVDRSVIYWVTDGSIGIPRT